MSAAFLSLAYLQYLEQVPLAAALKRGNYTAGEH